MTDFFPVPKDLIQYLTVVNTLLTWITVVILEFSSSTGPDTPFVSCVFALSVLMFVATHYIRYFAVSFKNNAG